MTGFEEFDENDPSDFRFKDYDPFELAPWYRREALPTSLEPSRPDSDTTLASVAVPLPSNLQANADPAAPLSSPFIGGAIAGAGTANNGAQTNSSTANDPTALEQYFLELINDARLDPVGNTARYITSYDPLTAAHSNIQSALNFFNVDADDLRNGIEALVPTAPLAWNSALGDAARTHNGEMIAADQQSHQLPGEPCLGARITAARYTGWFTAAENIFAFTRDVVYGHAGFMVDWGFEPNGIQSPPGHRLAIMNSNFTEVGIGVTEENDPNTDVGPLVVTQNFGSRGELFFLGVAYNDLDQDAFYSPGEGLGTLNVTVNGQQHSSNASGGYNVELSQTSTVEIDFGGAAIDQSATLTLSNVTQNVKADVVNGDTLRLSSSGVVEGFANIVVISLEGIAVSAGSGAQSIQGNAGNDRLDGGRGADTLIGGAGDDIYVVDSAADSILEVAGEGSDTVEASVTYRLWQQGNFVEDLTLTGTADIDGFGNAANNMLTGNFGDNTLSGGFGVDTLIGGAGNDMLDGGVGADAMTGGTGDDTYVVDQANDTIIELAGQGTDT
ncbi:MAG: CAP domain-containing protein, partial [Pseudomonadota bacterium]